MEQNPEFVFRAYGKCLLVGGYAVLYETQPGLVLRSDSHWFEATTSDEPHKEEHQPGAITVEVQTPQFPSPNTYTLMMKNNLDQEIDEPSKSRVMVTQASKNPFVDAAVEFGLRAFAHADWTGLSSKKIVLVVRQSQGFVKDEYCVVDGDDVRFTKPVTQIEKTGMGSSSCLTAAIVGSLIKYLAEKLNAGSKLLDKNNHLSLVNIVAQVAHSVAQGKIGSGFDVSCGVYGTQIFTRLPAAKIQQYQNDLREDKSDKLLADITTATDTSCSNPIPITPFSLPASIHLLMLEYSSGTDTRGSVKNVTQYLDQNSSERSEFLQSAKQTVHEVAGLLRRLGAEDIDAADVQNVKGLCRSYRRLMKELGEKAGVEVEPHLATAILDSVVQVDSVLFACCPGAGGYDALAVVVLSRDLAELPKIQSQIMAAAISIKEPVDGLKFLSPCLSEN